jgi:hypothetical protein
MDDLLIEEQKRFRLFYNQTIQPELRRLDKLRLRLLRWLIFSALGLVATVVLEIYIGILLVTLMLAIPIGFYIGYLGNEVRKFNQNFKPRVVNLILDFIDDGLLFGELKYDQKGKITLDKFKRSQIFITNPAVYHAEDYIEGRIGDIEFEMCELVVKETSRIYNRLDKVFQGIFVHAKFVHPPKGAMLMIPKEMIPPLSLSIKEFIANGGQNMDGFVRNKDFREAFTVYGSRNTKVQELLPAELQNFLLRYKKKNGAILLSFFGKNIYAAMPHDKDILEPSLFMSNVSFELVNEFYEDIYVAINLVIAIDRSH